MRRYISPQMRARELSGDLTALETKLSVITDTAGAEKDLTDFLKKWNYEELSNEQKDAVRQLGDDVLYAFAENNPDGAERVIDELSVLTGDEEKSFLDDMMQEAERTLALDGIGAAKPYFDLLISYHYDGAEEKLNGAYYDIADEEMKDGDFSAAAKDFEELGDFEDSAEMAKECRYQRAEELFSEKHYIAAAEEYEKIGNYKDAAEKVLAADDAYCKETADAPEEDTYRALNALLAAGYDGAEELRSEIYRWHAEITWRLSYAIGSMQGFNIYAKLRGGPDGASTKVTFVVLTDSGERLMDYTEDELYRRGSTAGFLMYAEDGAQIIGNTYTVEAYDGDGNKIGTKTGVFEEQ